MDDIEIRQRLVLALETGEEWDADGLSIPGALVREVLQTEGLITASRAGLQIVNAAFLGDLDLSHLQLSVPLQLFGTFEGRIRGQGFQGPAIWFGGEINTALREGAAVDFSGSTIVDAAFGNAEFHYVAGGVIEPAVNFWGAKLGSLRFEDAHVVPVEPVTERTWSLWLNDAEVSGDIGITLCRMPGEVSLAGATVAKSFYLDGLGDKPGLATTKLNLTGVTLGEWTVNTFHVGCETFIGDDLEVEKLIVWDPSRRPATSSFEGFWPALESTDLRIGRLVVPETQVAALSNWVISLRSEHGVFHRQPTLAIAQALANNGLEAASTRLKVAAQDTLIRSRIERWDASKKWGPLRALATTIGRGAKQAWRATKRVVAGHGYVTSRSVFWIALCVLGLYLTVRWGMGTDAFQAADGKTDLPPFFASMYTLDSLLPTMELGQADNWVPASFGVSATLALFKGAGAFFSAIGLGSLTGLLNRD